jgi:hypothetical protein
VKHRYCATQITDIDAFYKTITDIGGVITYRSVYKHGYYQCWFDVDEELQLDETVTFMMLKTGVQLLVKVKIEIY